MPVQMRGRRRLKKPQSSKATQIGMVEFSSAATPVGTPCIAKTVKPLPSPHMRMPLATTVRVGKPASGRGPFRRSQP